MGSSALDSRLPLYEYDDIHWCTTNCCKDRLPHKPGIHNIHLISIRPTRPICEVFSWDAWCPWLANICLKWRRHWLPLWPMASFWIQRCCVKGWRTGRSMTWHMQLRILFPTCLGSSVLLKYCCCFFLFLIKGCTVYFYLRIMIYSIKNKNVYVKHVESQQPASCKTLPGSWAKYQLLDLWKGPESDDA